jgi:TetR/AcrR family transcriptional repressor of nem operon
MLSMKPIRLNIRQHILDTAKPIILGKGFVAVGLNEVLQAADVPKGSFYHYFKSKELFGEALIASYFEDYLVEVELLLKPNGESAANRFMQYWNGWLTSLADKDMQCQCLAVKLAGEVSDLSEAMRLALHNGTDRVIGRLAQCVEEGRADGSLPTSLDAAVCAETLYEMWFGASLLTKLRRDPSALGSAMRSTKHLLGLST